MNSYLKLIFWGIFVAVPASCLIINARGQSRLLSSRLHQRVAKNEEETQVGKLDLEGDEIIVPYTGLAGNSEGRVFNNAIATFDPMDSTDDLPGDDGSDQKIAAIQRRIKNKVEELKASGQWGEEGDEFGVDPLRSQSLPQTMAAQVKACKPFESISDLTLTYILVLSTTVFLSTYLVTLRETLDSFIEWYTKTDFDITSVVNSFR